MEVLSIKQGINDYSFTLSSLLRGRWGSHCWGWGSLSRHGWASQDLMALLESQGFLSAPGQSKSLFLRIPSSVPTVQNFGTLFWNWLWFPSRPCCRRKILALGPRGLEPGRTRIRVGQPGGLTRRLQWKISMNPGNFLDVAIMFFNKF